jgi:hypothetical protein
MFAKQYFKSYVFWDITPCSPFIVNGRFGGICLHLQSRNRSMKQISMQINPFVGSSGLYRRQEGTTRQFVSSHWLSLEAGWTSRRQNKGNYPQPWKILVVQTKKHEETNLVWVESGELFSCSTYSTIVKMDVTHFSETSVELQRTTWRYVPKLFNHRCETLRSYINQPLCMKRQVCLENKIRTWWIQHGWYWTLNNFPVFPETGF